MATEVDNISTIQPVQPREVLIPQELQAIKTDIEVKNPPIAQRMHSAEDIMNSPVNDNFSSPSVNLSSFSETPITDYYHQFSDGELIPMYKDYMIGTDNQERLAREQTTGSKWGNGLLKLAGKTGTAILGGTIGTVRGAIEAIATGSLSAVYDNDFNTWLDDLNTKMDYKLPNYYSQQEQAKSLFAQMGTANFWANDFFGGLSFTLGMIVSEGIWAYATGGASLVARGALGGAARWSSKALGTGKTAKAIDKYRAQGQSLFNNAVIKQATDAGRQATITAARGREAMNQARFIYTSAGYEGGVEARHYMKEAEEEWMHNYQQETGKKPSQQEIAEFRNGLSSSGNAVFFSNIALVGGSNLAIFGRSLLGSRSTNNFKNSWFKENIKGVGYKKQPDGTLKAIEATTRQKIAGKTYDILRPVLIEGFVEEGGQGVIANTAQTFMLSAYDPDKTKTSLGLIESVGEGFKEAYGTKDGQKEVLIGAIIGLFGGGFNSGFKFNETSRQRDALSKQIESNNQFTAKRLFDNVVYTNKAQQAAENTDNALQRGDRVGAEISNDEAILAKIERDYGFEGTEQGKKDYRAYLYSSIETLKEQTGLDHDAAIELIEEQATKYGEMADEYTKNVEFAEAVFGTREFAEFKNAGLARAAVLSAVAHNLTIGKNADIKATDLVNTLKETLANVLDDNTILSALDINDAARKLQPKSFTEYNKVKQQFQVVQEQYNKIQDRLAKLNQTREQSETEATERGRLVEQFNTISQRLEQLKAQKETAFRTLNLKSVSENTITQEDLDNQQQNLQGIQNSLNRLENVDPQTHAQVRQILADYTRAVEYSKAYTGLAQRMINPSMRMTEINSYLTGMFSKNKKLEEGELEFFRDLVENYTKEELAQAAQGQESSVEEEEPTTTAPVEESMEAKVVERTQEEIIQDEMDSLSFDAEAKQWKTSQRTIPPEHDTKGRARDYIRSQYETTPQQKRIEEVERRRQEELQKTVIEVKLQEGEMIPLDNKVYRDVYTTGLRDALISGVLRANENNTFKSVWYAEGVKGFEKVLTWATRDSSKNVVIIAEVDNSKIKNKKPNNLTQGDFSTTTLVKVEDVVFYSLSNSEAYKITVDAEARNSINAKYDAEIAALEAQQPTQETAPKTLSEQIQEMIDSNAYTKQFIGENFSELIKEKPNKKDINRFKSFLKRISPASLQTIADTQDNSVLENEGFSEAEINEFADLNRKLGQWTVLDGVTENGNSIADLLLLQEQYQTQADQAETKSELTKQDYVEVKNAPETAVTNSYDTAAPAQTPDNVKVKAKETTFEISHLEVTNLAESTGAQIFEKNKKGELVEVDPKTIKEEGKTFVLQIGEKSLEVKIGQSARIITNKKALYEFLDGTDLKVVDYGSSKSFDLYQRIGDEFLPMEGDFKYNGREVNTELLMTLQAEDKIGARVDLNDPYNQKLLKAYNAALKKKNATEQDKINAYNTLMQNLHILITTQNGEVLGSLKAFQKSFNAASENTQGLIALREKAGAAIKEGKQGEFNLNVEIPVSKVFMGSPNYTVQENADGTLSPQTRPITEDAMKAVVAAGYVQNGQLTLNDKSLEQTAEKMFVSKFTQKTPVVVFQYQGRTIAFPVSLVKTLVDRSSPIVEALNTNLPTAQQIQKINQILLQEGLNPSDFILDPSQPLRSGNNLQVIERMVEQLEAVENFADIETWISPNFNLSLLQQQAEIAVDITNKPFNAGKLIMNLKDYKDIGSEEILRNAFVGTESRIIELRKALSNKVVELRENYIKLRTTNTEVFEKYEDSTFALGLEGDLIESNFSVKDRRDTDTFHRFRVNTLEAALKSVPRPINTLLKSEITEAKEMLTKLRRLEKSSNDIKTSIKNQSVKNAVNQAKKDCNN